MLTLNFSEEELNQVEPEKETIELSGLYENMQMTDYRNAKGIANSELQLFKENPASYEWNKTAPRDPLKALSPDFGTALHSSLLEPETYEDSVIVTDVKGRGTAAFSKFQKLHEDKIVLTEIEYDQIKLMTESAKCEPMFNKALNADGPCESSIFVKDTITGLDCKIRPDKIIMTGAVPLMADVKSTASLDDWRQDKPWLNPLFKFGYGFTAAYYLHVGSIHFQQELDRYAFLVVSKSASMGKYQVTVFIITKAELIEYGFWQDMLDALEEFKVRNDSGNFLSYEKFPHFHIYESEEVEIKFEGE